MLDEATGNTGTVSRVCVFKQDFLDKRYWQKLAREYGIRLPAHTVPADGHRIRAYMIKLHMTLTEYRAWSGNEPDDFQRLNPTWPLWACVGLLLEYVHGRGKSHVRV